MEMAVPITVAKLIVPPKARGCASETAVGAGLEIPIEVQVGLRVMAGQVDDRQHGGHG